MSSSRNYSADAAKRRNPKEEQLCAEARQSLESEITFTLERDLTISGRVQHPIFTSAQLCTQPLLTEAEDELRQPH